MTILIVSLWFRKRNVSFCFYIVKSILILNNIKVVGRTAATFTSVGPRTLFNNHFPEFSCPFKGLIFLSLTKLREINIGISSKCSQKTVTSMIFLIFYPINYPSCSLQFIPIFIRKPPITSRIIRTILYQNFLFP